MCTWASVMVVSVKASASFGWAVLLPPMMSACAWLRRASVSASTEAGSPSTHWNLTLLGSLSMSLKICAGLIRVSMCQILSFKAIHVDPQGKLLPGTQVSMGMPGV